MTTPLAPLLPRLGDSSQTFVRLLGHPRTVQVSGLGVVRRFLSGGQTVSVLFDRDQAIALHASYADDSFTPFQLQYRWYRSRDGNTRFYVGEDGWAIVSERCPREGLHLLSPTWRL